MPKPFRLTKVTREQFLTFIDTTPDAMDPSWVLLGIGITDYGIDYNPQVETVKWIINKNATSTLESYQKEGSVTQEIHKNDPAFAYINSLRDKTGSEVETNILDIDTWNGKDDTYPAKKSKVTIAVTKYMSDKAIIEYTIHYNGDPEEGTVTMTGGTEIMTEVEPSFTPSGSI